MMQTRGMAGLSFRAATAVHVGRASQVAMPGGLLNGRAGQLPAILLLLGADHLLVFCWL